MTTRPRRLALWKRAVLHGVKRLVRKHPGAALDAAGASIAYAGREVAHYGADFAKEKIEQVGHALGTHDRGQETAATLDCRALAEKLSGEERRGRGRRAARHHTG
jgi:hypothetical protein